MQRHIWKQNGMTWADWEQKAMTWMNWDGRIHLNLRGALLALELLIKACEAIECV